MAELKFDGERVQLHRDGDKIRYWTRNMNDFGPRGYHIFDTVVKRQARIAWHWRRNDTGTAALNACAPAARR